MGVLIWKRLTGLQEYLPTTAAAATTAAAVRLWGADGFFRFYSITSSNFSSFTSNQATPKTVAYDLHLFL